VKGRQHVKLPGGAKGTARSPPKPGMSESAGRNTSEPKCSPVTKGQGGRASLVGAKAVLIVKIDDKGNDELPRDTRDGTRREECAEHGRPHGERVATATDGTRRQPRSDRRHEESDGVMSGEGAVTALEQETPAI
jgi:hypothetical protein